MKGVFQLIYTEQNVNKKQNGSVTNANDLDLSQQNGSVTNANDLDLSLTPIYYLDLSLTPIYYLIHRIKRVRVSI